MRSRMNAPIGPGPVDQVACVCVREFGWHRVFRCSLPVAVPQTQGDARQQQHAADHLPDAQRLAQQRDRQQPGHHRLGQQHDHRGRSGQMAQHVDDQQPAAYLGDDPQGNGYQIGGQVVASQRQTRDQAEDQ